MARPIGAPMPIFEQGDTVRVPCPYTDRPVRQRRPALVVSRGGVGSDNNLLWVVMITSAENRPWRDDLPLGESQAPAGLSASSVIRSCKIATIETRDVEPLGRVGPSLLDDVLSVVSGYLGRRSNAG